MRLSHTSISHPRAVDIFLTAVLFLFLLLYIVFIAMYVCVCVCVGRGGHTSTATCNPRWKIVKLQSFVLFCCCHFCWLKLQQCEMRRYVCVYIYTQMISTNSCVCTHVHIRIYMLASVLDCFEVLSPNQFGLFEPPPKGRFIWALFYTLCKRIFWFSHAVWRALRIPGKVIIREIF